MTRAAGPARTLDAGPLEEAIRTRNAGALAEHYLGVTLTPWQARIARRVAFLESPRLVIFAMTQWGKSQALACGIALGILFNPGLRWVVLFPSDKQTAILRNMIVKLLRRCRQLRAMLKLTGQGFERLAAEGSRNRWTFSDGSDLRFMTVGGEGTSVMGEGGDVVLMDEAGLIADATATVMVNRMLSANPRAVLIKSANPWPDSGHLRKSWESTRYERIQVDWRIALQEGRVTQAFLDEQRELLPPAEWEVLYEARFPGSAEDQLIPRAWIERARRTGPWRKGAEWLPVYGGDYAEAGGDRNVLTPMRRHGERVDVLPQLGWFEGDTMQTVARIEPVLQANPGPLAGDAQGLGKPIQDRLRERGWSVLDVKAGKKARDVDTYDNLMSELLWQLRTLFERNLIELWDPAPQLLVDLERYRFRIHKGRRKVEVAGGKKSGDSPDFGDSLAHGLLAHPMPPKPRVVRARNPLGV